jgi:hypothetical protein
LRLLVVVVAVSVLLAGCSTNEVDNTKETKERGPEKEETRLVTHIVTVEEPAPSKAPTKQGARQEEGSPEDVLALQYEYINTGDFEQAYSLFAQQSRREVSLAQYRTFFEANAPYSVTDYSFLSVRTQGSSASVEATFTVNSAGGVEQLQRTQQLVRENGDWRVLMRPEQTAAFTAKENASEQSTQKTNMTPEEEEKGGAPKEEEAEEIAVTGVVEDAPDKADGTPAYGIKDESSIPGPTQPFGKSYILEGDYSAYVGERITVYGIPRLDNGMRILDVTGIE